MQAEGACPYCGEAVALWIDEGGGPSQHYVEDCAVCCRPIEVDAITDAEGDVSVSLRRGDA